MKKIIGVLFIFFAFQSCSWQEYFVMSNKTNSDIIIEYEIENPPSGFSIFDDHPSIYKLSKAGDINWNETSEPNDSDTSKLSVKIILAPNTAVIFGHLSNDNYKKHDQYFINSRHFNLKKIKIVKEKTLLEISPKNFDDFFMKKNGIIGLTIKEN